MKLKLTYFLVIIMVLICSLSCVAASDLIDSGANHNELNSQDSSLALENENQYELTTNTNNEEKLNENSNEISTNSHSSIDCESTFNENENILADVDNSNTKQYESTVNKINEGLSEDENSNSLVSNSLSASQNDSFIHEDTYGFVVFGSNVISLNIYEVKNGEIVFEQNFNEPSVTASYTENGNLTEQGIEKLISILEEFVNILESKNIDERDVFATASMRKINNPDEVIDKVKEKLGISIEILSGEEEAAISFNAIKNELNVEKGLFIDLGGGSCEISDFCNKTIDTSESMPIGSNSLYKDYVSVLHPNETEAEDIKAKVIEELEKLSIGSNSFEDLFGSGGTIYTIKLMLIYLNWIDDETWIVDASILDELYEVLKKDEKETYQKIISVDSSRIHTLVPGLICTMTILKHFNVKHLHFCKSSFEDGVLLKVIEREKNKEIPQLNTNKPNVTADEDVKISISLNEDAHGEITILLNNATYKTSVNNGIASIKTPSLNPGTYTAIIRYSGDEKYLGLKRNIDIYVKSAKISASNMNRGWNSSYDYQVKLIDNFGNPIKNKLITFTVGKKQYYSMTDKNGLAKFKATLNVGKYNVTISSALLNQKVVKTLKIIKHVQNNKNLKVYYNSNKKYKIKIIGDNGLAETKGKAVKVIINNRKYTYKTASKGFITIVLNKNILVGKHKIKVQYKGFNVQNTLIVKQILKSKGISVKKTAKRFVLKATLKNGNKAIRNKRISFRFNGKTFYAKTNSKGLAKVSVNKKYFKKLKRGKTYAAKITYLKDSIKTSIKIK